MDQESDSKLPELMLRVAENGSAILETFTKSGIAYLGYKSANHWTGALTALVALKLATGGNLAGGVAGTAVLTGIGVSQIIPKGATEAIVEGASVYLRNFTLLP